jgi:trk system potassium uptake protein TrkA
MVIGLGRFGGALAEALVSEGYEVLGIDADPEVVQEFASVLTHVVSGDTTHQRTLRQLGAAQIDTAVVGIGDVEASVLTTTSLVDIGVPNIWAKAVTDAHGKILERVGAQHVVFPERDMGVRVAHLVTGTLLDYIELDAGFALVETTAPSSLVGQSLADADVRRRWGVTVVCIKPEGMGFTYATPQTVVGKGDVLLVAGEKDRAEAFAELTTEDG